MCASEMLVGWPSTIMTCYLRFTHRSAWKPAVAASSCTSCGDNIYSEPDDQITLFAITPDAKRSMLDVRASDAACCKSSPIFRLADHWARPVALG